MCKEYINIQTKEKLNKEIMYKIKDNSMLKVKPELWQSWNFEKNDKLGLDIYKMTQGSGKKAWWICEKGHEWDTCVYHRTGKKMRGCPYCSGNKILIGFNDLWTTHPNTAKILANSEDGYKYSSGSDIKLDWKCPKCSSLIKSKVIHSVVRNGVSCINCKDGMPYGEKILYYLLFSNDIEFKSDITMDWSDNKRYDFYLPNLNIIIESHGDHHYNQTSRKGARSLKEEQENDRYKEQLARDNGIEHYIVIDARESNVDWMSNSVRNSILVKIIENMDFKEAEKFTEKSFMITACELWNKGCTIRELEKELHFSESAIRNYLRKGTKLNLCSYSVEEEYQKRREIQTNNRKKPVIQLTPEGEFIREWDSATDASKNINVLARGVASVCTGKRQHAGGFKWMHKDKYEQLKQLESQETNK